MNTPPNFEERSLTGPMMMILAGSILLISRFVPELGFEKLWPVLLIGGGVAALYSRR